MKCCFRWSWRWWSWWDYASDYNVYAKDREDNDLVEEDKESKKNHGKKKEKKTERRIKSKVKESMVK